MKKFVCMLTIICYVLGVCSCATSQTNSYSELEERISRLEKLFGESNQPTAKFTENPIITSSVELLPLNSIEPVTTSSVDGCIYDLSEMTPENIVETIKYYIDSRPQNGDTYENVKSRLQVEPLYWNEENHRVDASFVKDVYTNYPQDCIKGIGYSRFDLGMNGITLENCDKIYFTINFNIVDYARAEKIFDAIVNYFNSNTNNSIKIQKNGGRWSIYYSLYDNKMNANSIFIAYIDGEMVRTENSYSFHIELKINHTNQE